MSEDTAERHSLAAPVFTACHEDRSNDSHGNRHAERYGKGPPSLVRRKTAGQGARQG